MDVRFLSVSVPAAKMLGIPSQICVYSRHMHEVLKS
jgi:hypothetical protein